MILGSMRVEGDGWALHDAVLVDALNALDRSMRVAGGHHMTRR